MKKALSLLLVLTLILGVFPISVYAEETTAATITMTTDATESLKIGDTFSVTAALSNNPGYASITLTLLWNSNVVKFTGFATEFDEDEEVDVLKDTIIGGNIVINNDVGIITSGRTNNSSKNGTLFIANFEVIGYGQCNISLDRSDITKFTLANLNKDQISVNYVDTAVAPLVVSEPVDEDAFTVYYQIEDTIEDDDSDTVHEVDLDTNFNVGVYVKAGAEQVMQAFDIYPEWNENLEFVSVAGEDNVTTIVDKMADTDPHFQTQFEDSLASTDVTITTTGTKIATLTMKLKASAIYDTHYPIWIEAATNLAKEKDPESVKKVTVTAEGDFNVETLKTYTVTYDANGGSFEGEAPTQKKQHNVELTLEPGKTPSRDGYTFQGWSTTSGDNNADDMITNYTANEATTLYAIWKANTHTVTWKSQDGNKILDTTEVTHGETPTYNGETPTKDVEGYTVTFAGWATAPNMTSGKPVTELGAVNADITYYAAFMEIINQYTITFDTDGGSEIAPITKNYDEAVGTVDDPTKTGYTFNGWTDVDGNETEIPEKMPGWDMTLYAQWRINRYTITFNTDGGSEIKAITQDYKTAVTAPANPTKTGYTFLGWLDEDGNDATVPTNMPAGNVTLKANWKINKYTITFDTDGGSAVAPITQDYNTAVTAPANPTKDGYTFAGWEPAVPSTMPAENLTVKAKWTQTDYSISHDTQTVVSNQNNPDAGDSANMGDTINIVVTPSTGYDLVGDTVTITYVDENGNTLFDDDGDPITETITVTKQDNDTYIGSFTMPASHVKVTAVYEPIEYTITFNNEDGTEYKKITQDYGTDVTAPADPSKTGYTFAGWVDEDGNKVTFPTTMPAEDVTLTATWTINQYTITFNNEDGSEYDTITQDYGTAVTAPADPTKTGYTFKSWDKEIPITMPAEDMTITAQWTINQYTITFVDTGDTTITPITRDYGAEVGTVANPTKTGYNFLKWINENTGENASVPTTMPAENITLKAIWEAVTYNVTLNANGGKLDETVTTPFEVTFNSAYGTLAEPARGGYKFDGWFYTNAENEETRITADSLVSVAGDHELVAKWTANEYTVTFDPANGGEVSRLQFKTDTGFTTPAAPEYAYHTFKVWKVTSANGNWHVDHVYNAGTAVKDNYGDVTLTAQWEGSLKHVVEDYKYAPANYVMLRIETNEENTSGYKFGDIEMYYTADIDYLLNGKPVLVTLIPMNNGKTGNELVTYVSGNQLTDAGLAMLTPTETAASTYSRSSGLINKDNVVNIADANAVYQMVLTGGDYYTVEQLAIVNRLMADMDAASAEHRGSIADVNKIVTIINNAANAN